MKSKSILRKKGTKELYQVMCLGHWSDIENIDDPSDTDSVKWYGNDQNSRELYVSSVKGHTYVVC